MYGEPQTYVLSRALNLEPIADAATAASALMGNWKGQVMTPWAEPYEVNFTFDQDNYTANSLTSTRLNYSDDSLLRSPFYFGSADNDQPLDYTLTEFAQGQASGEISIMLKSGEVVKGTLSQMEMSLNRGLVVFTFSHYGKYGPMRYLLKRQ